MYHVEYLGIAGSIIIGISFVPQTYKVIRNNDIQSLSEIL